MNRNLLILVDEKDNETGTMDKLEVHRKGLLHRAFSIVVKNNENQWRIHRRAMGKYHSEGLWTNTCCSHPMPGEDISEAAHRRLQEEMGFDCNLEKKFHFIYQKALDNELTEHELDHVFVGKFNGKPNPDPEEVSDFRWIALEELKAEMQQDPENFTYWFKVIIHEHEAKLK